MGPSGAGESKRESPSGGPPQEEGGLAPDAVGSGLKEVTHQLIQGRWALQTPHPHFLDLLYF